MAEMRAEAKPEIAETPGNIHREDSRFETIVVEQPAKWLPFGAA